MNRTRIIFAGSLLAVSILFMEINLKEKSDSIKVALDELRGNYLNSKRLEFLLIHKTKPSEPTIKFRVIENSLGDHKMVTQINWDNFIWAFRKAVINPNMKFGLYLRDKSVSPKYNGGCGESANISYQKTGFSLMRI